MDFDKNQPSRFLHKYRPPKIVYLTPSVAATPGMTSAALMVTLTTPHAGMPMFRLSSEERRDIIAYVLSLKADE
jgi:mono/diheme cytochrome c family protein